MLKKLTAPFFLSIAIFSLSCQDLDVPDDTLAEEVKVIDDYLKANVTDYVAYDQSGIRLVIHEFGDIPPVRNGQRIQAEVKGKLFSNGNYFTDIRFNSLLDSIGGEGLKYAISALMVGSEASVYIPSKYGFGTATTNNIPANSILVYEVKLHKVTKTQTEQTRFTNDTTAIKQYIAENNLEGFQGHPSGIWYKITQPGSGLTPKVYDAVNMIYSGSLLTNGSVFDAGSLSSFTVFGLIDGFKVGLPLLDETGSAIFLIPSGLAYGTQEAGGIPENANLKFEVELTRVIK